MQEVEGSRGAKDTQLGEKEKRNEKRKILEETPQDKPKNEISALPKGQYEDQVEENSTETRPETKVTWKKFSFLARGRRTAGGCLSRNARPDTDCRQWSIASLRCRGTKSDRKRDAKDQPKVAERGKK